MDRYILENYLAKIGRSWYQSLDFRRHAFAHDPISKFGVGLLSCFVLSTSLALTTKREPLLARDTFGWHVRIPSRDGYFRVAEGKHAHVGTTIVLEIGNPGGDITAATISAEIKQVGLLVKHHITLKVGDLVEAIEPIRERDDPRLPFVRFGSLDDDALASLQSLTVQFNDHHVSPDGGYEAFFSCLLPRDLSSITSLRYDKWQFGSQTLDLDDLIVDRPRRLFLKGVGSDLARGDLPAERLSSTALNVLKPSLARPDLSRAHVDIRSVSLNGLWKDVASRIREIIGPHSPSIENRVAALSAAIQFAGLPEEALTDLVPLADWPVWTLERGSGLSWRDASAVLNSGEILEAPDELRYVFGSDEYFAEALRHVEVWKGPACFVALSQHPKGPWWSAAATLVATLLEKQGFVPTDLRFVNSAEGDDVPLACRVWRRQPKLVRTPQSVGPATMLTEWRKDSKTVHPYLLRDTLHSSLSSPVHVPSLLRFPDGMEAVAAIGSLYWNQNNPKIQALVEFLLNLSVRSRNGAFPGRVQQVPQYVNSTSYLGYVVEARHSGARAAIERYRELLDAAEKEGLAVPKPFVYQDFFPGSVGKYWNPYHYPIWSWPKSGRPVGAPWSVERV